MVLGHVQGMSRVPPDHPEGGRGKELYSRGLWWRATPGPQTTNPKANAEHRLGEELRQDLCILGRHDLIGDYDVNGLTVGADEIWDFVNIRMHPVGLRTQRPVELALQTLART